MNQSREYLIKEGLDQFFDLDANSDYVEMAHDSVSGKLNIPFPPDLDDLAKIH